MDRFAEFYIPFTGLKVGPHEFQFQLGDSFFDNFEYSEISACRIQVDIQLEKSLNMMVLDFEFNGEVQTLCDRCQDPVQLDISGHEKLVVQFGDKTGSADEEVLVLGSNEHKLDLSHYLYEFSHLLLPSRKVHDSLDECNADIIKILERNRHDDDIDPRWEGLKNL